MDILQQFGELSDDISEKRKYAKWRAAYIHNCLKNGEEPISGNAKILYTKEEEDNFKDFMTKEEYDRMNQKDKENNDPESDDDEATTPADSNKPEWSAPPVNKPVQPEPSYVPPTPTNLTPTPAAIPSGNTTITPDMIEKAQKYCKWASSALNYEDVNTAIDNIQKALHLLQFGKEL